MGRHLDSLLKRGFRATKCATLLKLTISRIKLARNQKTNSAKQLRKEIAQLLKSGQDSHAYRLKTEQLVRIQNIIGAYDLIDHYCKLVVSRMQIIDTQRNCPLDVKEAVASLIFAAPRCTDLVDLPRVRDMFTAKYGKEFTAAILELRPDHGVNTQIIELLSTRPAAGQAKLKLMQEIAAENNIEWKGENEFTKPPEDLPDKSGKLQPESESSQTGSRRDQSSNIISMQSPKILYAGWEDGEVHTGIPAGDTNLNVAVPETGRVTFFGAQTIPGAGIGNVSNLPEDGQPLRTSQVETGSVSESESDIEFQDAVEENVSDSKEAAESKMGFQNAVEAEVSVLALNDDSTEGTSLRLDEDGAYLGSGRAQEKDSAIAEQAALHADYLPNARTESPPSEMPSLKSDEVTRMPSQRFYEDGANFGSRGRQYKDSASAAEAALPHEDNVPNARTESPPPSKKASSMSDEATRMPSQRFYEDGANLGSSKRHYKESASAGQAALADEEDVPNTGSVSPPPSEKASSKSDEVPRVHSQKFYEDGVYLGSGKSRQFKDFASAAQAAFESAALAAEAAQAAIFHARQESGSFKYSSFSNSLGAKASATEIPKTRPEFNSKLFESNVGPEIVTEELKGRPEFDSRIFESNVDPKKVIEEPKARPEIRRKFSDASTVYLDSFPSTNFTSARKIEERSDGETTSSSDDDMGGMSNPTWDSEDVSQEKGSPAKSGSGHGYFKQTWDSEDVSQEKRPPAKSGSGHGYFEQKSSRNSEGSADEADGSADDAIINPVSLWNRRVAGARLATEDAYAERPKFDDEEDVPYAYGEHSGRNSLEKMNSGSGEFSAGSSFSTRTLRGSSKQSSFSMGTLEEDAGGEKLRFERSRLPEDSLAAWRGEVFSHKPKFDDEVNDGLLASGTGQFAREDSLTAGRGEVVSHKPKFDDEVNDGLLASNTGHFARVSSGHDREKADAAAVPAPLPISEAWRRSEAKPPRWTSSSSNVAADIQYEQKKTAGRGDSRRTTWATRRPLVSPPEAEQQDEATAASATSRKNFAEVDELDIKSYDRSSSSTKVAANEAIGGGGSASAAATLPPRQTTQVANNAAVASRRTTKIAANDTAVQVGGGGGGGSASGSAVTLPPPSTHASPAAVHFPPSRQNSKVAADDTAVASRRATKFAADDAAVEAGGDGPSASAAAVNFPPSRQTTKVAANDTAVASRRATNIAADDATVEAGGDSPSASAAATYFPPPPPTRPPPPAPTLQLPLRSSPSSLTSPLTPSFSDPVVLASTPTPPHTPSTASTSSSPVPHLSTAASAPPPAARDQLRAPHRHPKLPDYDDFVAHFERLRQESRTSPPS